MKARTDSASGSGTPRQTGSHSPKSRVSASQPTSDVGRWLLLVALLLAALAAYQPAWHGGMLWDDEAHVTKAGLRSLDGLRRIWFELGATQQYYPLVHSTFWVQHKLWGDHTFGYHLLNIGLHALSAFLLMLILRRLAVPGAFLAAMIFAVHPVHVESVAWITELKNTLSGVFYLGATLSYLHFDADRQRFPYAVALSLFLLALLSKTVTATLPVALLIVFWWQRGTLGLRRDVIPLLPFFGLGAAGGLLTAWIERTFIGAQGAEFHFTAIERCLIAGRAVWFYLGKLLWPTHLIFNYPRWSISQGVWWQYLYPIGLVVLGAALWRFRARSRAPLATLLLFCTALIPVLGFLNVYPFRFSFVADHFQYLASLPIIALAAAGLAQLIRRMRVAPTAAMTATMLATCVPLGVLTWQQSHQYSDAETLYRAVLGRNPSSWMAHNNLGMLKLDVSAQEAATHLKDALRIKPDLAEGHCSLGVALYRMGRFDEAVAEYREAARLKPDLVEARNNLCDAFRQAGRVKEATAECLEALRLKPDFVDAHVNLGAVLQVMGGFDRSKAHLEEALRLQRDSSAAHFQLGITLGRMRRFEEAVTHFKESLRLNPSLVEAHTHLGGALRQLGRLEEALAQYQEALGLKRDSADAHFNLASVLQAIGRLEEAVAQYTEGLRYRADDAAAHNNLGGALQVLGRLDEAIVHYKEAVRIEPDFPAARNNLARLQMIRQQ